MTVPRYFKFLCQKMNECMAGTFSGGGGGLIYSSLHPLAIQMFSNHRANSDRASRDEVNVDVHS